MKWTDINVDVLGYDPSVGDNTVQHVHVGKAVDVEARRPYGSVSVKVDCDKIVVTSFDGDGEVLEKRELKIDDLVCDGKADDGTEFRDEMKLLDGVRQELTEAGIGEQPNPLAHEPEGQEAGGQEEGGPEAGDQDGRGPQEGAAGG